MKSYIKFLSLITLSFILIVSSCKKDDKDAATPPETNPQEQITTVILSGYNSADETDTFSATWEDLDGDAGNAPVIQTLQLDSGKEYYAHILLIDKTKSPYDTISNEVEEEKEAHQFFYALNDAIKDHLKIQREDNDDNGLPVGLKMKITTKSSSAAVLPLSGSLNIILSHYDGIPKTLERSPESDIDIHIPVTLK